MAALGRVAMRFARQSRGLATAVDSGKISFTFTSPNLAYYNKAAVVQVNVPSASGEFGVLPYHVPALSVLKPGVVSVFESADVKKEFFVSSGTITVNEGSSVQILAEEAYPLSSFDLQAAKSGLDQYNSKLSGAANDVERAEIEIAIEVHTALVRALESSH